jgi:hypothetical protein
MGDCVSSSSTKSGNVIGYLMRKSKKWGFAISSFKFIPPYKRRKLSKTQKRPGYPGRFYNTDKAFLFSLFSFRLNIICRLLHLVPVELAPQVMLYAGSYPYALKYGIQTMLRW